jgi:Na+:H+ antiporter, NhaA family
MSLGRAWHFLVDNSILLVAGTAAALVWANVAHVQYELVAHLLHFVVNGVGMAFFFALAAKEVFEATLPGGGLSSPRQSAVPLIAAVGGMVAPALLYVALASAFDAPELYRGWAIPCATDIAFSYMAARVVFSPGHPAIPFLLLLAIADDALGLIVLAVFYPSKELRLLTFAMLLGAALVVAWWLRRRRVTNYWPYVIGPGVVSWAAFYLGGFHPALSLVPVIPFMPHRARDVGLFAEAKEHDRDTLSRFEHDWKGPVAVILGLFGLANAGVAFSSTGLGTWLVLAGLLIGKPLGITLATWLAERVGFRRPAAVTWRAILTLGMGAAIGFTVALFFATAAFPPGERLDEVKMGALLSFVAAPISLAMGLALGTRASRRRAA